MGCNNSDKGLLAPPNSGGEGIYSAESLVITPKNTSLPIGLIKQMHADAVLTNGEIVNVTTNDALTWGHLMTQLQL